jgi:NAD(P)-dependent dehydrogenase (short-subunit alcohol dehydrogenase family)
MDLGLAGKVALVTGSSSGIGVGMAHMLAGEGVSVIVHGRDEGRTRTVAENVKAKGGKAYAAVGDLDKDADAEHVCAEALKAFGQVDILVNNAGGRVDAHPIKFFDIAPELWAGSYNRNVISVVRLLHKLVPPMLERGWGRVINVSSASAQSPSGGVSEYAAAKAALSNLTLSLSKQFAGSGVTVNTVSPGMIRTPALDDWLASIAREQGYGADRDKAVQWVLKNSNKQSVARLGEPEDIAFACLYLASPLSGFVTGANLRVCGGAASAIN